MCRKVLRSFTGSCTTMATYFASGENCKSCGSRTCIAFSRVSLSAANAQWIARTTKVNLIWVLLGRLRGRRVVSNDYNVANTRADVIPPDDPATSDQTAAASDRYIRFHLLDRDGILGTQGEIQCVLSTF